MTSDTYWSIDFLGVDQENADAIVDQATRLGLAVSAVSADPGSFLTLHLDIDTVQALDLALATCDVSGEAARVVDTMREAISHWVSAAAAGQ